MSTIPSQQRAWSLLAGLAVSVGVYVAAQVRSGCCRFGRTVDGLLFWTNDDRHSSIRFSLSFSLSLSLSLFSLHITARALPIGGEGTRLFVRGSQGAGEKGKEGAEELLLFCFLEWRERKKIDLNLDETREEKKTLNRTRSPCSPQRWPRTPRPPGTAPSTRRLAPRCEHWRRGDFELDVVVEGEGGRESERPRKNSLFFLLFLTLPLLLLLSSAPPRPLPTVSILFFPL